MKAGPASEPQRSGAITVREAVFFCFCTVANEIQQYQLNLDSVGKHGGQEFRQIEFWRDPLAIKLVSRQALDLVDHLVDVKGALRRRGLFEKGADISDDIRGSITVPDNAVDAACARGRLGLSPESQVRQVCALATIPASGWLISWALDAESSATVAA